MVKCINCQSLVIGFNLDIDTWVHCSIKHATDIAMKNYRKQPKITKMISNLDIVCKHYQKKEGNTDIFNLAEELGIK